MIEMFKRKRRDPNTELPSWMHFTLRFAGVYNILAGIAMMTLYHEGFGLLGLERPDFMMPIQLVGLLVAVFGVGYLMADRNPRENRNVIYLGFMSKALGPIISLIYIANGMLPIYFLAVLFFADTIYLFPFWKIYQRLGEPAAEVFEPTILFPVQHDSANEASRRRAA